MSQNKKNTHQCAICNAHYSSCDLCSEVKLYTPWRALCDTQKHYQIYMTIAMLRGNVMTVDEAKDSLNHIGVTVDEIKTFIPAVQETLLPIMEEVVIEFKLYQTDENDQIKTDIDEVKPQAKSKKK